jgi:hypothetical protein
MAFAAGAGASPTPQVIQCWSTCSTNCVNAGKLRGRLCLADGVCAFLTRITIREANQLLKVLKLSASRLARQTTSLPETSEVVFALLMGKYFKFGKELLTDNFSNSTCSCLTRN